MSIFKKDQKTWCETQKWILETNSVLIGLKPLFSAGIGVLKNARFCARFLDTNWARMVHTVLSQLKQNQKNTSGSTIFLQKSGFALITSSCTNKKPRTLIGHIGDFLVHKKVLFRELIGGVKRTPFLQVFEFFFLLIL